MCNFALKVSGFRKGFLLLRGFSDKRSQCTLEDWESLADSSSWLTSLVQSCSTAGDLELPPVDLWFHGGTTLKLQHLKLVSSTEYRGAGSNFKFRFNLKAWRWCDIYFHASRAVCEGEQCSVGEVWVLTGLA